MRERRERERETVASSKTSKSQGREKTWIIRCSSHIPFYVSRAINSEGESAKGRRLARSSFCMASLEGHHSHFGASRCPVVHPRRPFDPAWQLILRDLWPRALHAWDKTAAPVPLLPRARSSFQLSNPRRDRGSEHGTAPPSRVATPGGERAARNSNKVIDVPGTRSVHFVNKKSRHNRKRTRAPPSAGGEGQGAGGVSVCRGFARATAARTYHHFWNIYSHTRVSSPLALWGFAD